MVAKPIKSLSQLAQRLQAHGNSAAGLNIMADIGNNDPSWDLIYGKTNIEYRIILRRFFCNLIN